MAQALSPVKIATCESEEREQQQQQQEVPPPPPRTTKPVNIMITGTTGDVVVQHGSVKNDFDVKALAEHGDLTHETMKIFGKEHTTLRKSAMYGGSYRYAGKDHAPKVATGEMKRLIDTAMEAAAPFFARGFGKHKKIALVNCYPDGNAGIGPHRDNERDLADGAPIISVSIGAPRMMRFDRARTDFKKAKRVDVRLAPGSLLVMGSGIQTYWKHSIPVQKKVTEPRISVTIRCLKEEVEEKKVAEKPRLTGTKRRASAPVPQAPGPAATAPDSDNEAPTKKSKQDNADAEAYAVLCFDAEINEPTDIKWSDATGQHCERIEGGTVSVSLAIGFGHSAPEAATQADAATRADAAEELVGDGYMFPPGAFEIMESFGLDLAPHGQVEPGCPLVAFDSKWASAQMVGDTLVLTAPYAPEEHPAFYSAVDRYIETLIED